MSKKVLLSQEEANALENALELNNADKGHIVQWHAQNLWSDKLAPLNDLDVDTVCQALYVGYEVEVGPEEKVIQLYESYPIGGPYRILIKDVITALNMQIQGINC
jgi:hypothetical protein